MRIWSAIKTFTKAIIPTAISVFRTVSSAGFALLVITNFFKYIRKANHPLALPISYLAIGLNIFTNLTTVVPHIFRQFLNNKTQNEPKLYELSKKGKSTYFIITKSSLLSLIFATLNYYLGVVVLSNFAQQNSDSENDPSQMEKGFLHSLALACAIANLIYQFGIKYGYIKESAAEFAKHIDEGNYAISANTKKSILISSPSIVCTPCQVYFSMRQALPQLPYGHRIPNEVNMGTSVFSAGTAIIAYTFAEVFGLSKFFNRPETDIQWKDLPPLERYLLRKIVFPAVLLDAVNTIGISTFLSIVFTLSDLAALDPYNPVLITAAILFATSKTIPGYIFSGVLGYLDAVKYYLQPKPTEELKSDLESGGQQKFYSSDSSNAPLLMFTNSDAVNISINTQKENIDSLSTLPYSYHSI